MIQQALTDKLAIKKVLQKAHSSLKSNVYLAAVDDELVVVKDYSKSTLLLRETLCLLMRKREIRTLNKLSDIRGIPAFCGELGPYAYKIEYIEGTSPSRETLGTNSGLLRQLQSIIERMHQAGVTHNDTRTNNLIYATSGQLYLIDFGAVFYRPQGTGLLSRPGLWLFNYLTRTDHSKVARLKEKYCPEELSPEDLKLIKKTRFARKITKFWKKRVLPVISPAKHGKSS